MSFTEDERRIDSLRGEMGADRVAQRGRYNDQRYDDQRCKARLCPRRRQAEARSSLIRVPSFVTSARSNKSRHEATWG